eukprot:25375-Eustigmatos_ZCMA.PRE.1
MQVTQTVDQKEATTTDPDVFDFQGTPHDKANKLEFSALKKQKFVDSDSESDSGHVGVAPGASTGSGEDGVVVVGGAG